MNNVITESFDIGRIVSEQDGKVITTDANLLPTNVLEQVNQISSAIKFDQTAISNYGVACQSNISALSQTILSTVKTKDSGEIGVMLTGLVRNIQGIDTSDLTKKKTWLSNISDKMFNPLQSFITKQKSISANINNVAKDLDAKRVTLLESVKTLDKMYDSTVESFKSLQLYIYAGFNRLEIERDTVLKDLEAKSLETKDQSDVQKFVDYQKTLDRFEKRLHDMMIARHISLLQGPGIRVCQHNNTMLAEEIQNSILNAIPAWEQSIVLGIESYKSKQAIDAQKLMKTAINDILRSNSELLKQNSIDVATMAQETLIDIETVNIMQDNLLGGIDAVKQIELEGKKARQNEMTMLVAKEKELRDRLVK